MKLRSASGSSFSDSFSQAQGLDRRTGGTELGGHQEWSAVECLLILYRRKTTLFYFIGAGLFLAGLISLVQPRAYRSEAVLEFQGVNENFLNTREIYPTVPSSTDSGGTYLQTQTEILEQDALIEQVVKKLHLEMRPEFQRLTGPDRTSVSDLPRAAEILKRNVKIVPSRGSRIIRIVCEARDPQGAADVANTLAQTFIEQSIDERQQAARQIQMSLSLQLEKIRAKLARSETQLAWHRTGMSQQHPSPGASIWPADSTAYNALKLEVEADRRIYASLAQRVNDAQMAAVVRQPNIRIVGPAQPAAHPYKPNLSLNLAIGLVGGLILAIGWVMLQEQSNSFLRTPGEAGMYLTLPELGAIPQVANPGPVSQKLVLFSRGDPSVEERATMDSQLPGLSESFRTTLASILSAGRNGDEPRILVVTSAQAMEGKTTVVSNLAVGLAEIGYKVLLIDGDLRHPRLHKVFDQANSWGLSSILSEKNAIESLPLDALVKKTEISGVYLLPSGVSTDNIFGLLYSGRMARLLPRFRKEFDYVLVDAPPCLEFADARIIARHADQLLLVVRANHTDRRTAQIAVQRLLLDGVSVMGVILNRFDPGQSDLYRYAFYYGLDRQGLA